MPEINGANWEAVSALLDELLDLDDAQRSARLAQLRMQNPALSDEVAELLARHAVVEREGFLEAQRGRPARARRSSPAEASAATRSIARSARAAWAACGWPGAVTDATKDRQRSSC